MEEDEPLAHAPTATATAPIIVSESKSLEPASKFSEDQGAAAEASMDMEAEAPMDMEADAQQQQHRPCHSDPFFSGLRQSSQIPCSWGKNKMVA
jgi:hypothetical protein